MRAIGFRERLRAEHGGSISHVQMDIGECAIMIGKQSGPFRAPHAAGGNTRGMEAASMVIVKKGAGVSLNNGTVLRFQVDDQEHPYMELRRVVENWNKRRPSPVRPKQ